MKQFLRLTSFFFYFVPLQAIYLSSYTVHKEMYLSLLTFFLQKCGACLRAALKTIVIPLRTVFTWISATVLINPPSPLKCGAYLSTYCNLLLKSLLHLGQNVLITFRTSSHLGQNVITFRTLLHLGSSITFRPSTSCHEFLVFKVKMNS